MNNEYKDLKLRIPKEENPYYKSNAQYFDELLDLVTTHKCFSSILNSSKRHLIRWMQDKLPQLKDEIYNDSTRIFWILHGLTDFPKCKICNKNDNMKRKNVISLSVGYREHCSTLCTQKDPQVFAKKLITRQKDIKPYLCHKKRQKTTHQEIKKCQEIHELTFITENNVYYNNSPEMFLRLVDILKKFSNGYVAKVNSKRNRDLRRWIDDQVPLLNHPHYKVRTKIHWILRGLTDFPRCKNEKCAIKFDRDHTKSRKFNVSPFGEYEMFCSYKCCANDEQIRSKGKQTRFRHFGNENFNNRAKAINTMHQRYGKNAFKKAYIKGCKTKKKRYGNKFWNNSRKIRETKASFSREKIDSIVKKIQNTCMKRYGFKVPSQNAKIMRQIVAKIQKTCLKRYGVTSYTKTKEYIERIIDHNMKVYGKKFFMQTDKFKKLSEQTCLKKYGVKHFLQSQKFKDIMSDPEVNKKRISKQFATKKKNGTLNTSAEEKKGYELLCKTFGKDDIHTQFISDLYPFHCDYYIKSKDLYIELNEHWSHGGHFFDEMNESDVALAQKWANSKSKYYKNSAYVWTNLDKRKHETAISNNLNYLVFWKVEELEKWCNAFLRSK